MQTASELILEDTETETAGRYTASIVGALDLAEEYLLRAGQGVGSADVGGAVEQVRHAVEVLMHLQQRLEALQWNIESEEMDAELLQRGYVGTVAGEWTSPTGESGLSQFRALLRVDEELGQEGGSDNSHVS
ncbi:MAG TPA: hypothetical protein VFH61_15065 [Thermoleophilia bacterium]|nr:hypothetical protein [Thermoleophilia bacterium]